MADVRGHPVVLEVEGDEFIEGARLLAVLWEGSTTVGDTVMLVHRDGKDSLLWPGRTNDINTYQGINWGTHGLHAPTGFKAKQLSSGRVMVYLRED